MKQPIHKNLNTSFVNVSALVRYLGSLQFVGSIRIELASYEADIVFTSSMTIEARDYDHIAGRISHGKSALQRILIRAREPHGRINVYRSVTDGYAGRDEKVFVDKSIAANARKLAGASGGSAPKHPGREFFPQGPDVENAAMLTAISGVLRTIDEALAEARLSFSSAFRLSCESIENDYAFLRLKRNALMYREGSIVLNARADADTIASAVFAALQPIFRRLRNEQKYAGLLRELANHLRAAAIENRSSYQSLGLTKHIDELLNL